MQTVKIIRKTNGEKYNENILNFHVTYKTATTTKANQSVVTNPEPVVHKTNNTELPMGMSKEILRKFLNN